MIVIFDRPNAKTRTIITDDARDELVMLLTLTIILTRYVVTYLSWSTC